MIRTGAGLLSAALLASACTTVTVVAPEDGRIILSQQFLAVGVTFEKSYTSSTAQIRGFGFFSSPGAVSLGLHSSDITFLGRDDCRAVLWFSSAEEAAKAQATFKDMAGVCVMQKPAQQ